MYLKFLDDDIMKTYGKSDNTVYSKINKEAKHIASGYEIADRNDDAFLSLKDHKDTFYRTPKSSSSNPAKSEIGKISKFLLKIILPK